MDTSMTPQTPTPNKTKKYIKTAVILAVVLVFGLFLWFYVPLLGGNQASYCARCHLPEYLTWQQSNHIDFQCSACHEGPGLSNFFKYQGMIIKEMFLRASGDTAKNTTGEQVPNSVCLSCHSENRKYTPSSDTIIPHEKHIAKGIACVSCHAGVVHGRIVERGETAKLQPDDWNESVAAEQMDFEFSTPRMSICLDCHGKRGVNETCSVCHSRQVIPENHKNNWTRQHGLSAEKDFKPCNLCHSYTFNQSVDLTKITVKQYINNNTFCLNCHLQKPSTHQDPKFRQIHGELEKSRGLQNCFTCHDLNKSTGKNTGPVNKVYCNKCHWFKSSNLSG